MTAVLWLLAVQGTLGAFDTLYFHEWRARLPGGCPGTRPELALHAARSIIYAIIFASLPWIAWSGAWACVLGGLLACEIVITLSDFAIEDTVRKPLGGVYTGERTTHFVMAIVYGGMLGRFVPEILEWSHAPTGFARLPVDPAWLRWVVTIMGAGVLVSGLRDAAAALGLRGADAPWGSH